MITAQVLWCLRTYSRKAADIVDNDDILMMSLVLAQKRKHRLHLWAVEQFA